MPTQNVVTESLTARADAYLDLEDDINVTFRQSRMAMITLEYTLGEVRALRETAERRGDTCTEYHLRQISRDLSAVFDAVTELDAASGRLEQRYYLGEAA